MMIVQVERSLVATVASIDGVAASVPMQTKIFLTSGYLSLCKQIAILSAALL